MRLPIGVQAYVIQRERRNLTKSSLRQSFMHRYIIGAPPALAITGSVCARVIRPDAYPKEGGGFVRRDYELGFILNPEVNEEQTRAILERVEQVVANHDGQIVRINQWGRRRLGYPIQHNRDGFYVFIDMILTPETVIELDRTLKVSEDVLRYMIKRRDPKTVQKEREARAAAAAAPATQSAEAQDEIVSPVHEEVVGEETEAPVAQSAEDMEDVPPAIEDEDIEDVPPAIDEEDSEAESV